MKSKKQKRVTRGKEAGRGRPKQVNTDSYEPIDQPKTRAMNARSTAGQIAAPRLADVDRVMRTAESLGWQSRFAFNSALLMLANGASASEAQALFRDAAQRVQ
jgi:hypothetical protein